MEGTGTGTGETYTNNGNFPPDTTKDASFKETVGKYLRLSHQTLAEMLALRDEEDGVCQPNQLYIPYYPYYPYGPVNTKRCPISMAECANPFGDCINCPYQGGGSHNTKFTTTCTSELK